MEILSSAEIAFARSARPPASKPSPAPLQPGIATPPAATLPQASSAAPSAVPQAAAGNRLGALAGAPITGPSICPSLTSLIEKHIDELLQDGEITRLRDFDTAIQAEQKVYANHSPVVAGQIEREALRAYSSEPNEVNLQKLRACKTLSASDHILARQYSGARLSKIYAAASPLWCAVMVRLGHICQGHSDRLESSDRAAFSEFGLDWPGHPLVTGLRRLALDYCNYAKCKTALPGQPELISLVLKCSARK
jgi:hypothetical protein